MPRIKYRLRFPSSVYAAITAGSRLYVGGSVWDRRKVEYSKEIAKKTKGVVYVLHKQDLEDTVFFPHMVYSLLGLPSRKIFVGCKDTARTFNLIDRTGAILKQKDDKIGKGCYNAVFDSRKREILVPTRSGKLEILDTNLRIKKKLQLASAKTRLWSVDFDSSNIYTGDYDGNLFVVDRKRFKKIGEVNLKKFYPGDKRLKKGFGPSLWGLKITGNRIITGNRWGDIIVFNKKLQAEHRINAGEDVSCIEKLSKQILLIGTRYGKLYSFDLKTGKLRKITEIKPTLQKENAIWGMTHAKDGVLVCWADGVICKII
ncbi:hypothetical protein GF343_00275 [Candidatus Woesearchaeota archaeon]|nr:hypothetical protein [Candidatus Woesearchaeota archaeon]